MKKRLTSVLLMAMCLSLSACSQKDIDDVNRIVTKTVNRLQDEEDKTVLSVKNAENSNYPGITYGEAFDSFFAYPSWRHFTGSTEDSDEEHEVVEFTGNCTYQDVEVEARLQFTLYDDGTFQATYLAFNEVPQNMLMLANLINTAFTSESGKTSESYETESYINEEDEDYNSYSSQTSSSSNEPEGSNADDFVGEWGDPINGRMSITISKDGNTYDIYIYMSNGALYGIEYYLTGYYDSSQKAVIYEGEMCEYSAKTGNSTIQSVNESGKFYISDGGLYWHDDKYPDSDGYPYEKTSS